MKTMVCKTCDFWFNGECLGLKEDPRIEMSCAGGYSVPDNVFTATNFGCLFHSELQKNVKYKHGTCGFLYTREEIDKLEIPHGLKAFRICSKCSKMFEIWELEIITE